VRTPLARIPGGLQKNAPYVLSPSGHGMHSSHTSQTTCTIPGGASTRAGGQWATPRQAACAPAPLHGNIGINPRRRAGDVQKFAVFQSHYAKHKGMVQRGQPCSLAKPLTSRRKEPPCTCNPRKYARDREGTPGNVSPQAESYQRIAQQHRRRAERTVDAP
jgi:hypothetical protein